MITKHLLPAPYTKCASLFKTPHTAFAALLIPTLPTETRRFVYDGWNLVQETIQNQQSTITNHYVWGKDLSGTMQGAGGIGGLLAVSLNGSWYFPFFDANGNIMAYVDESGTVVAEYTYDAFGGTIAPSPPMAGIFAHRFSTKYFDSETGLYYYGYRFYDPVLHRWLNRDPIEEEGGFNLFAFCGNNGVNLFDILGLDTYLLFCGDEAGVPFRDAAMAQKTSIEAKQRDATVLIIDVRTFDDVQKALKEAICIKEIHFYIHSGPGIIFLDMNSRSAESNISELGGRHVIPQSHFERGFEPISFASRGVASLYRACPILRM